MNLIELGCNEELINILTGSNSLLDGNICHIDICEENDELIIQVRIKMRQSSIYPKVLLKFNLVEEYFFSYSKEYIFGVIERIKFFKIDDKIYISLDPYDDGHVRLDSDGDYILSKNVVGYSMVA